MKEITKILQNEFKKIELNLILLKIRQILFFFLIRFQLLLILTFAAAYTISIKNNNN